MKLYNANPGFGTPMTEEEVKNFLVTADKLNVHIGTVDENGEPNVHPAWYYYDKDNNKMYVGTGKGSKKVQNMKKSYVVYYCIDQPTSPYKGVRGKAKVRISEDINYNVPIYEKMMLKYFGNLEQPSAQFLLNAMRTGDSVLLELTASFFSTWIIVRCKELLKRTNPVDQDHQECRIVVRQIGNSLHAKKIAQVALATKFVFGLR